MTIKLLYIIIEKFGFLKYFPSTFCILKNGEMRILQHNLTYMTGKGSSETSRWYCTGNKFFTIDRNNHHKYICANINDLTHCVKFKTDDLCIKKILNMSAEINFDNLDYLNEYYGNDDEDDY